MGEPTEKGRGGQPGSVITAAVAAARRVSASAPPRRLIGAAGRGGGGARPRALRSWRIDRLRGLQLAARGGGCAEGLREGWVRRGLGPPCAAHVPAIHRELSQPTPLLSPQNASHIALGSHLRPPFLGVPSALCQTPGEEQAGVQTLCLGVGGGIERSLTPEGMQTTRLTSLHPSHLALVCPLPLPQGMASYPLPRRRCWPGSRSSFGSKA